MANLLENSEVIQTQIRVFDDLRPKGKRIFLLRSLPDSSEFNLITEITGGWFVKFNDFREQMKFEFATLDESFGDQFALMSDIGYGAPDADGEIDVYQVEIQDKISPDSSSPKWKCFGKRSEEERFAVPE